MTGTQARFLREKLGLGVKDFALALGVSWGAVYQWERTGRPVRGHHGRKLRLLWAKHVQGPENADDAAALLAAQLEVPPGDAALLLLRHHRGEGETWARAVERIVEREEKKRSSALAG
jgi:transcriptional regulator with XRE-family HTH domain